MKRESHIQKRIGILFFVFLLSVGCNKTSQVTPAPALATPTAAMQISGAIRALGTVRPAQTLQLSFGVSGPIKAVPARLGTAVSAGDLLVALDTSALQLELANAQAQVAIQQAALDVLLDGPSQVEIDRAQAAHMQQVSQAETALRVAQLQLEQALLSGPDAELELARGERARLELQLAQARAGSPQGEVTVALVALARTQDALATAQDEYKKALDRPWEPQRIRDALAQGVQQAQWEVEIAQAHLGTAQGALRAHALGIDLLAASGGMIDAQLGQALEAQSAYTVTLALLAVRVEQAQQDLAALNAWTNPLLDPPSPETVTQARARLQQAELAVEQVRWQMAGAEIHAPFGCVISAVHVSPGEWAIAGALTVEVLDTARWLVETRNVGELAIGRVQIGQESVVRVIAFRDQPLRGQIVAISPVAVVQQGDTTYTLTVELQPTELNLRPGMNAEVELLPE
jgi:HlyD family secretion protein